MLWCWSCIAYFEHYTEYDPFITPPECFSPWISDTTEFWEQEATLYVQNNRWRPRCFSASFPLFLFSDFPLVKSNHIKLDVRMYFGAYLTSAFVFFLSLYSISVFSSASTLFYGVNLMTDWLICPTSWTALNLFKITLSRWKKNWVSRASPDRCEILWPSSLIKEIAVRGA